MLDKQQLHAGLSLIFAVGQRPSVDDIDRLLATSEASLLGAQISHRADDSEGWVELLASGLTFDLEGLDPAPSSGIPEALHRFGVDDEFTASPLEAISLLPGQHIAGGNAMMPVVKTMAGLVANLALHLTAKAVCWHPAGTWMDPNYFARIVLNWQSGGAFPALGLTGIDQTEDGHVVSNGLDYFVGQEVQVEAAPGEPPAETVKLAMRVIDYMVLHGPLKAPRKLDGPSGETLMAEPSQYGQLVWVWRDAK
ncbi:MAG: hypothetical protein P8J20_14720 [Novosphingobium sp.]|nr:hypothetical protein [Novosphingobium sp.]